MEEVGHSPQRCLLSRSHLWSCCYSGTGHRSRSRNYVLHPCCCDLCKKRIDPHPGCFRRGCSCCCCHGHPLSCCPHQQNASDDHTHPGTSCWDCLNWSCGNGNGHLGIKSCNETASSFIYPSICLCDQSLAPLNTVNLSFTYYQSSSPFRQINKDSSVVQRAQQLNGLSNT